MVERDPEDDLVDEVTEDLFNALADLHAVRERHRFEEDEIDDLDEFLMEAVEDPEVLKSQEWWKNDGPQLYMALKYIIRAKEKIEADLETRPRDWDELL